MSSDTVEAKEPVSEPMQVSRQHYVGPEKPHWGKGS